MTLQTLCHHYLTCHYKKVTRNTLFISVTLSVDKMTYYLVLLGVVVSLCLLDKTVTGQNAVTIPGFRGTAHRVSSGDVTIVDTHTVRIKNFHYDGSAPDVYSYIFIFFICVINTYFIYIYFIYLCIVISGWGGVALAGMGSRYQMSVACRTS